MKDDGPPSNIFVTDDLPSVYIEDTSQSLLKPYAMI